MRGIREKGFAAAGTIPAAALSACQYVRKFPAYAAPPCPARQLRSIAPHAGVTEYRAAQEGKILLNKILLAFSFAVCYHTRVRKPVKT